MQGGEWAPLEDCQVNVGYVGITSGTCASNGYSDIMHVAECKAAAIEVGFVGGNANDPHRQTENDRPHGCRRQTFGPPLWINDKPNSPTRASNVHSVVCKAVDLGCGLGNPGPSGCDNQCGSTAEDLGCGCGIACPVFVQGPKTGCEFGYTQPETAEECRAIAEAANVRYWGGSGHSSGADPRGCIYRTPDRDISFNTYITGSTKRGDRRTVCVKIEEARTPILVSATKYLEKAVGRSRLSKQEIKSYMSKMAKTRKSAEKAVGKKSGRVNKGKNQILVVEVTGVWSHSNLWIQILAIIGLCAVLKSIYSIFVQKSEDTLYQDLSQEA